MGNALLSWRYNWFYQAGRRNNNSFRFFYYLTCISFGWYDYKSRQVPGINSSLLYSFLAGFGAGTPQQEAVPKGQEFSRIENLWPRDGSCSYLICSNSIFCNCFQIVKAHKQQRNFFLLKWWCSRWAPPLFYFIFEAQNHYFHNFEQWQRFKIFLQTDVKYGI